MATIDRDPGVDGHVRKEIEPAGKHGRLYPGQGVQEVGMGKTLCAVSPAARAVYALVDRVTGMPITDISHNGPLDVLSRTDHAQLAIFAHSAAAEAALEENDNLPHAEKFAGHSLGLYNALVAAEAMSLETAARLLKVRSAGMQLACELNPSGLLATSTLDAEQRARMQYLGLELALVNTDDQEVYGGTLEALDLAIPILKGFRKPAKKLPVAGAFHTSLMEPALEPLLRALDQAEIHNPRHLVLANTDSRPLLTAAQVRTELLQQVVTTVRWTDNVRKLVENGVEEATEMHHKGPLVATLAKVAGGVVGATLVIGVAGLEVARVWNRHHHPTQE